MTGSHLLSATVLANVQLRWPSVADLWAAKVDEEFSAFCDRYQATPQRIFPARYGFVAAVDTADGPLVFRSSPDPQGANQAAVMDALADLGAAPYVHESATSDHGTWVVIDRVVPGTPLSLTDPSMVDPQELFAPLAAMRNQPSPHSGMPSILDWLRVRLEDDQLTDLRPGTIVAPESERRIALSLLSDLADDHIPSLCHGDASSGNIIAGQGKQWMYIDPRGVSGESCYDAAVLANRVASVVVYSDVHRLVAEVSGVEIERLSAWMSVADAARV